MSIKLQCSNDEQQKLDSFVTQLLNKIDQAKRPVEQDKLIARIRPQHFVEPAIRAAIETGKIYRYYAGPKHRSRPYLASVDISPHDRVWLLEHSSKAKIPNVEYRSSETEYTRYVENRRHHREHENSQATLRNEEILATEHKRETQALIGIDTAWQQTETVMRRSLMHQVGKMQTDEDKNALLVTIPQKLASGKRAFYLNRCRDAGIPVPDDILQSA